MDEEWSSKHKGAGVDAESDDVPMNGRRQEIAATVHEWMRVNVSEAGPGRHDIKFPMPKAMNPEMAKVFFEEVAAHLFPEMRIVRLEVWYLYTDRNLVSVVLEEPGVGQ